MRIAFWGFTMPFRTHLPDAARRSALRALSLVAGGSAAVWPWAAWSQSGGYPQRPVRLIVPNAPGSSVDTIGRQMANALAPLLGQSLVVDNRAGAAGALGIEAGKTAVPDGYTLIMASSSSISVAPLLQKAVAYDPMRDFEFVSLVAVLPNVLVCNTALSVASVPEFLAYAKAQGGRFNMASAGPGSVSHLAGVALANAAGFESLHVPYKGGSQSVGSVVSGETHWTLTPAPAAMGLVNGGRLKALGHSMARGTQPLGNVPAIAETLPGFEFASWIGLMAPKGTPPPVADAIRRSLATALQQPALREAFAVNGAVPASSTGDAFREFVGRDIELNRKAIRAAGVQPE
jgi:tripartite-type tricarboxylate transporter receptor subunit TctC